MRWGLFGALASLVVMVAFATAMQNLVPRRITTPSAAAASGLARALSHVDTDPTRRNLPWIVTHASSAHHALVLDVEAEHPDQARDIASEIVSPVRTKYEEVLIYIRPAGAPPGARVRRIQWTPQGGYVEGSF
jgi:hypothetical protein